MRPSLAWKHTFEGEVLSARCLRAAVDVAWAEKENRPIHRLAALQETSCWVFADAGCGRSPFMALTRQMTRT